MTLTSVVIGNIVLAFLYRLNSHEPLLFLAHSPNSVFDSLIFYHLANMDISVAPNSSRQGSVTIMGLALI
jgi:hypothetical protein